ncbi:hypothetical protein, partial [Vibrio parahaemolyticus]|uniref:hypothetical protein n=1 Tax=Vibrio parahaemolyticus TaxID=670 RepID=UPI001C609214
EILRGRALFPYLPPALFYSIAFHLDSLIRHSVLTTFTLIGATFALFMKTRIKNVTKMNKYMKVMVH